MNASGGGWRVQLWASAVALGEGPAVTPMLLAEACCVAGEAGPAMVQLPRRSHGCPPDAHSLAPCPSSPHNWLASWPSLAGQLCALTLPPPYHTPALCSPLLLIHTGHWNPGHRRLDCGADGPLLRRLQGAGHAAHQRRGGAHRAGRVQARRQRMWVNTVEGAVTAKWQSNNREPKPVVPAESVVRGRLSEHATSSLHAL